MCVFEKLQREATEAGGLSTKWVINILIHPHVAHSKTVSLWEKDISCLKFMSEDRMRLAEKQYWVVLFEEVVTPVQLHTYFILHHACMYNMSVGD